MISKLQQHAVDYAWQNPAADGQLNILLKKLTPDGGTIVTVNDGGGFVKLPKKDVWFHVYTIGTTHPNWGNLNIREGAWVTAETIINTYGTFLRIYNEGGVVLPSKHAYFTKRDNGSILIAIPVLDIYRAFNDDVYFRIYAGKSHLISPTPERQVTVHNFEVDSNARRNAIIAQYRNLVTNNRGHVAAWVNGLYRPNFVITHMAMWDDVEIVVDNSVKRIVTLKVGDLRTFSSVLDSTRKYLLHLPKETTDWIFSDDVEIHAVSDGLGYYYNLNQSMNLRQLTHNDLSIPTKRIRDLWGAWNEVDRVESSVDSVHDLSVMVSVREDYSDRPVLFNTDRIHELYKLEDGQIVEAMVGSNSTVPEWQAANLEQSPVNRLAATSLSKLTKRLATDAYGYHGLSYYFADTPQYLEHDGNFNRCSLNPFLVQGCTVYEYDKHGKLLGYSIPPTTDTYYIAKNPTAHFVEVIPSVASNGLDVNHNAPDMVLSDDLDYKFYLRKVLGGVPSGEYEVAVRGKDYTFDSGHITWSVDRDRRHPTIVTTKNHIFYTVEVEKNKGRYTLPLMNVGEGKNLPITYDVETVEVWVNGHSLVMGIDYTLKNNIITIVTKVWFNEGEVDTIAIRGRGIHSKRRIPDHGYIIDGKLSNNDSYDTRDGKVVRIVGAGRLFMRDMVEFGEKQSVSVNSGYSGFPYSVDDPTIPLRNLYSKWEAEGQYENTYTLRDSARDFDKRVEAYLDVYLEKPEFPEHQTLPHYYHLYTPVLSAIVADLLSGILVPKEDDVTDRISTKQLDEIMLSYNKYLDHCPARNGYDARFSIVHPHALYHTVEVSELGYVLLERVNHRYLNSGIQLNHYLKINEGK